MMSVEIARLGIRLAHPRDQTAVLLRRVGAVHRLENFCRAGLQRQMDLLAHPRTVCHGVDHPVSGVAWGGVM